MDGRVDPPEQPHRARVDPWPGSIQLSCPLGSMGRPEYRGEIHQPPPSLSSSDTSRTPMDLLSKVTRLGRRVAVADERRVTSSRIASLRVVPRSLALVRFAYTFKGRDDASGTPQTQRARAWSWEGGGKARYPNIPARLTNPPDRRRRVKDEHHGTVGTISVARPADLGATCVYETTPSWIVMQRMAQSPISDDRRQIQSELRTRNKLRTGYHFLDVGVT